MMAINLMMGQFRIFQLYSGVKGRHIQQKPSFEFWSIPGLVIGCMIISRDAGQQQSATVPKITRVTNPYSVVYSGQLFWILCFLLSVFNTFQNSTIYYKLDSMLDDFAQQQANVSVLTMFKVSQAKSRCSQVRYSKCIFSLLYFQFMMDLLGYNHIKNKGASVIVSLWAIYLTSLELAFPFNIVGMMITHISEQCDKILRS